MNADMPEGSLAEAEERMVDARCHLHDLSQFDDESFDVVELYHVIEHASRLEAKKGAAEMYRVLRAGGELVVECPDLAKSALNYLAHPDVRKIGIDGMFGDPGWETVDAMLHKTGYNPASLRDLLSAGGFDPHLIFEIAPRRYPQRDVRLVAYKSPLSQSLAMLQARERAQVDSVTLFSNRTS